MKKKIQTFRCTLTLRYFYLNYAFKKFGRSLSKYDAVLLSGNHALSAALSIKGAKIIYYCHTVPRFAYDLYDYYKQSMGKIARIKFYFFCHYIRWDFNYKAKRVDYFLCNSENVRQRIKKFTGMDAEVVYPPVDIQDYRFIEKGTFYLSTARIEGHKRVELVVEAFMEMPDKKLVVASGGGQLAYLKALAKGCHNIVFVGWLTKDDLVEMVGRCIATIYIPMDEDFGISPVESMAAGKPVIAVDEGGLRETISDGVTGILCNKNIIKPSLIDAVNRMSPEVALSMKEKCEQSSQRFSVEYFKKSFQAALG